MQKSDREQLRRFHGTNPLATIRPTRCANRKRRQDVCYHRKRRQGENHNIRNESVIFITASFITFILLSLSVVVLLQKNMVPFPNFQAARLFRLTQSCHCPRETKYTNNIHRTARPSATCMVSLSSESGLSEYEELEAQR